MDELILTFDGTFDGFLSAVYYAVKNRVRPRHISIEKSVQTDLTAKLVNVPTDSLNSEKVRSVICDKMGLDALKRTYYAFLNSSPDSATAVYKYLLYGLKYGKKTSNYLSEPDIFKAYELARAVTREADRVQGFLRFSVMEGGVEYAPFEPVHDIITIITPHFAERLKSIPFVIHDIKREKAAVYTIKEWFLTDASEITLPSLSHDEKNFRAMWHEFYRAIAIRERKNERLQNNMLPKMYRKHMTEFMPQGNLTI